MKKTTKTSLLISLVMLLAGASLVFYALYRAQFDWNKLSVNIENETYDYVVMGTVQDVTIQSKQGDVRVLASPDTACSVQAKCASREVCSVEEDDNILRVTCANDPSIPWYKQLWRQAETEVTVYLPAKDYGDLSIITGSGGVYVSDALTFANVHVETGSGDTELYAPVLDDLSVNSGSGEITVKGCDSKTISIVTNSGDIFCQNCRNDTLSATTSSGTFWLSKCYGKNVFAHTSSGGIVISSISVSERLECTADSGDILYQDSAAKSINMQTKSGNVRGFISEPMLFDVRSDSGNIILPPSGGSSICKIRSGNGDIVFNMENTSESE